MAITFRNAASANAATVAITTPAVGDVILVFAFNNASTTIPTVPAGYVSLGSNSTTATAGVAAAKVSAGNETSVPTFTNATNIVAMIYRGVFAPGAFASGIGNSASIVYPALTMKVADGTSWVAAGAIEKAATAGMNGTSSPLTSNRTNQTTVNGLDTNGGVASFGATTLVVTTSGRFVAFSVELIAMPLYVETLTQQEGGKVQIRGSSVDYNLQDAVAGSDTNTKVTGTVGLEQLSFSEEFKFSDPLHAAFLRQVDELNKFTADAVVPALGLLAALSDQLTQTDNFVATLLGGSLVLELLDGSGNTITARSSTIEQLVLQDPTFTETLEYDLALGCPHLGQLWDDLDVPTFVLAPSQVFEQDFTPWSLIQLPGNIIPFENFEFVMAPSLINMIERGLVGLLTDSYAQVLGGGALTEVLSDTLTMSDSLGLGYGEGMVEQFVFSDANSLGYGDLISDTLTMSDVEVNVLGINELFSDTLTMSDALGLGYGEGTVDQLTFSDSSSVGYGDSISETFAFSDSQIVGYGNLESDSLVLSDGTSIIFGLILSLSDSINNWQDTVQSPVVPSIPMVLLDLIQLVDGVPVSYVGENIYNSSLVPGHFPLLVVPGAGYGDYVGQQQASSIYWQDFFLFALDGNISLRLRDSMPVFALQSVQTTANFPSLNFAFGLPIFMQESESNQLIAPEVESLSDQLVLSDSEMLGYGNAVSDQLILSDSETIGYGQGTVDSLTITDSTSVGYGDQISDTLSLTDSEITVLGIAELFSDQLVMADTLLAGYGNVVSDQLVLSDSEAIGYGQGQVDSLTFSDSSSLGYGDIISDQLVLSDFMAAVLAIAENLSDQLVFSDTSNLGYGNLLSDALTLSDSSVLVFGLNEAITETIVITDSSNLGYGFLITDSFTLTDSLATLFSIAEVLSDTMTMADSETIGYGNSTVDSLIFQDSSSVGYGDVIADTLVLSDSEINVLGINELFSDQMSMSDFMAALMAIAGTFSDQIVMSDSNLLGYGDAITESLVLSEALVIGYGQGNVDSLTFSDSMNVEYGDLIADALSLSDLAVEVLGITEILSDTLTLSDGDAVGYGNVVSDQMALSDAETIEYGQGTVDSLTFLDNTSLGYGSLITDAMAMSDSLASLFSIAEVFADMMILSDSEIIGYGNATVDSLTFLDNNAVGYGDLIADQLVLSDAIVINAGGGELEQLTDSLTLSDSLGLGYGQGNVDALSLSDSSSLGFGDVISDQMVLSDSETALLGMNESFSDQMVESDAASLLFGVNVGINETLTIADSSSLGYGFAISDTETMSDALAFSLSSTGLVEQLSDTLALSEAVGVGYGGFVNDQLVFSDSFIIGFPELQYTFAEQLNLIDAILQGFGLQLSDTGVFDFTDVILLGPGFSISDVMLFGPDAIQLLMTLAAVLADAMNVAENVGAGYGNQINEQMTLGEQTDIELQALIVEDISDALSFVDAIEELVSFAGTSVSVGGVTVSRARIQSLSAGPRVLAGVRRRP